MFSKSCQYAIRAVLYLGVHSSEANKAGVTKMAEVLDVPRHFLGKILQQLSRQGVVSSTKGPSGGFFLSEANLQENLLRVVEAIDGPEVFDSCILGLPVCSSSNPCPLHVQAFAYREGLNYQLKYQTIKELADRIKKSNLAV